MSRQIALGFAALALLLCCADVASAASPRLTSIVPRGCQRGTEAEFNFGGRNLQDPAEIFFYSPGIEATKIEAVDAGRFKATLKIAPDCRLGEHVVQVRTKSGVSDYRTIYIGALPQVAEKEPNTLFEQPQAITLNVTVTGMIQPEDVDYFVLEAKQGQRISVEVEGMRLGDTMFDPYVSILDERRFELAASDDSPLLQQDPVTSIVTPADGKYIVQIRESSYGGNGASHYRMHVGTFPRPTSVYPAGGKLGEEMEVRFVGDPTGELLQKVKLPAERSPEFTGVFATSGTEVAPSANPFRLFEHGNVLEIEPNNEVAKATPATLPLAFNGVLQTPGDVDFFRFTAKKGEVFEVECYGRRIRSPVDPVMSIYNDKGNRIANNDDARGPDSYLRATFPADGEYLLSVGDHLNRGGADFVYRVEFSPVQPSLQITMPQVERYGQYRRQIYVAKGNRFGAVINASRANFGGALLLEPQGLPAGLTMVADSVLDGQTSIPVVFEATADAPLAGKLVDFLARHAEKPEIKGGFYNRAEFAMGAPGQSLYSWRDVNRLAVAVVDELPFKIDVIEPKAPLARGGSMQLKVVATRKPDFKAPINLIFPYSTTGVSAAANVMIPEGQTEALYTINAAANAPLGKSKFFILGSAEIGGAAFSSSQLATLEVCEPFVNFTMQRTAVEQGQETDVVCKVEVKTPFEGQATVQLQALPNKTVSAPVQFTKDSTELVFKVKTEKDSPAGKHKIFGVVTLTAHGEPVVHSVGGAELRIDVPLPPKVAPVAAAPAASPAAPAAAPAAPAAPKRLSRLEQLREEAKKAEQSKAK